MENLFNFYSVKVANMDEDLCGIADLEARKFCENSFQQFDFRFFNFYLEVLDKVSKNKYSEMIVCKSTFDDDLNSQYLGYLHGNINYNNSENPQFMLNGMYVLPQFRKSNVGRSLIIGLEETLVGSGACRIFSNLDNNSDGFLMRNGFSMGGRGADVFKYINSKRGQVSEDF
jgi:hypothetical protein